MPVNPLGDKPAWRLITNQLTTYFETSTLWHTPSPLPRQITTPEPHHSLWNCASNVFLWVLGAKDFGDQSIQKCVTRGYEFHDFVKPENKKITQETEPSSIVIGLRSSFREVWRKYRIESSHFAKRSADCLCSLYRHWPVFRVLSQTNFIRMCHVPLLE